MGRKRNSAQRSAAQRMQRAQPKAQLKQRSARNAAQCTRRSAMACTQVTSRDLDSDSECAPEAVRCSAADAQLRRPQVRSQRHQLLVNQLDPLCRVQEAGASADRSTLWWLETCAGLNGAQPAPRTPPVYARARGHCVPRRLIGPHAAVRVRARLPKCCKHRSACPRVRARLEERAAVQVERQICVVENLQRSGICDSDRDGLLLSPVRRRRRSRTGVARASGLCASRLREHARGVQLQQREQRGAPHCFTGAARRLSSRAAHNARCATRCNDAFSYAMGRH